MTIASARRERQRFSCEKSRPIILERYLPYEGKWFEAPYKCITPGHDRPTVILTIPTPEERRVNHWNGTSVQLCDWCEHKRLLSKDLL